MMSSGEVLAIIPARGGSKGIPRKNIRLFAGYPLIAFSIAAARQAKNVTRVIVSTDDEEIAAVAQSFGAETPFLRPAELAADKTTDLPVFQHALAWLEDHDGYRPEIVLHLHPTSPVRPLGCLDQAIETLRAYPEATCVRSVVTPNQTPYKMWQIEASSGHMVPLVSIPGIHEAYNTPRQLLPPAYLQTGHVNAISPAVIRAGSMTGEVIYPLIVEAQFEVDLDTLDDWQHGEWMVAFTELDMVWPEKQSGHNLSIKI